MQRVWRRLSWQEKNELWRRWLQGASYKVIAEGLGRSETPVVRTIVEGGGLRRRRDAAPGWP